MVTKSTTRRDQLLKSLQGQQVIIRDLQGQLSGWAEGVSPYLEQLRKDVDNHLDKWFSPGKRREKLRADDAALFTAMWWSYGDYEALRIAAYLSIFMFAWDDETDSSEFSTVSENVERSQKMRDDTIIWVRHCLGVGFEAAREPSNQLINNFTSLAEPLQARYTLAQRRRLCDYIELYINDSAAEWIAQQSHALMSLDHYKMLRMGTSAVLVFLQPIELCHRMRLPESVLEDPEVERLQLATNVIISVGNDILSFRKELASGQVDSLIPILYDKLGDVQQAVDAATQMIQDAIDDFESTAAALINKYGNSAVRTDVARMIKGCRYACTTNVTWSLRSRRYGLGLKSLKGGVRIEL